MTCVVIDDEPLARKGIQLLIEAMPSLKLLKTFPNAIDADEFLKSNPVDLLFIDIQMPKINGMEYIRTAGHHTKVIITTAYPQFAAEAFELDVVDYLVKPIRFERFFKAVNKAMKQQDPSKKGVEEEYIFIRTERKYIRTSYNEIDFIEGLKDYVIIHCGEERHIVAANLKSMQSKLPASIFTRINKSYIINARKIKSVDSEYVNLANKQLPIGENYKRAVLELIQQNKVLKR
jgi:DNA-binding LytR/AlgR family response regulator